MRRAAALVVVLVVIAVVVVASWLLLSGDRSDPGVALAPAGTNVFADDVVVPAGPSRARFSPNGARLAVFVAGRVDLATADGLVPITPDGGNVVDAAWFGNGETLLVAEGPVPTGTLAVVDIDGTVRGSIPLQGAVEFGSGHGMAIAPGGKRAVVTGVVRPLLEPQRRFLVAVDLESGAVSNATDPGGDDEFEPRFLDDGSLVHSTSSRRLAGVIDGVRAVWVDDGELVTDAGESLADLGDGETVVDVSPRGDRALVVATRDGVQPRLRSIRLRSSRPR